MEVTGVEQFLDHHGNAAYFVKVLGDIFSARLQIGDVRRFLEDFSHFMQIEVDARLMGNRWQMQRAIGGATGGGNHGSRILQRLAGDDIARTDAGFQQFNNRTTGCFGIGVAALIWCRGTGRVR